MNILMIVCDQLRKDCLGCYGNTDIHTPNLDRLAAESIVCTGNYVANPICMPNRMTMFSGMYPRNHGIWTNGLLIRDEGVTLMNHLKEFGYATASIGKIHFEPGGCEPEAGSRECEIWWEQEKKADLFHGPYWGFDYIELQDNHHKPSHHMIQWFKEHGGTEDMTRIHSSVGDKESGIMDMPAALHPSSYIGERTVNYLRCLRPRDKPFFLTASFTDPHHPFVSPRESYEKRNNLGYRKPVGTPEDLKTRPSHYREHLDGSWSRSGLKVPGHPGGVAENTAEERIKNTYAMIELIDENVGKILKELEVQGLKDNTIIIFTSDHGELLGDFGLWHKGPFFYEGLINTPLIIKIPGVAPGICHELISDADLVPTICELIDVPIPYYVNGISHRDTLIAGKKGRRTHCLVEYRNGYFEKDCNCKVLITKRYKYMRYENGEKELTDLLNDPCELANVCENPCYQEVERELAETLLMELLRTESKKPYQLCLA